jgi:hypothetical protein
METNGLVKNNVPIISEDIKSKDGKNRYYLKKTWDETKTIGSFLGINPSKADSLYIDNTVMNCNNLAVKWGWGGYYILNLYPFYSTNPELIEKSSEAEETNLDIVSKILIESKIVVLICGNDYLDILPKFLKNIEKSKIHCLKKNKGGGYFHARILDFQSEAFRVPIQLREDDEIWTKIDEFCSI